MRTFKLYRKIDLSGNTGVGFVGEGIQFSSGIVVISFLPVKPLYVKSSSTYDSIDDCIKVHGHNKRTVVIWDDEMPKEKPQEEKSSNEGSLAV